MGRTPNLRELLDYFKDKAAITRATLLSKPDALSPHLAVLRPTSHHPAPAPEKHLAALLSVGRGSRLDAAACVHSLMDRLHSTRNSVVALKCLICVHRIIRSGCFILQDQLSVYPRTGGRNYLNLSNFRDESGPAAWQLSLWVRWYARALEQMMYVCRVTGSFLSTNCDEVVSALSNGDLLRETEALVGVMEEIQKAPEYAYLRENEVAGEVVRLVGEERLLTQKEVLARVKEARDRLACLSFADSVELVCVLKRLEGCKERVLFLCSTEEKGKVGGGDILLGLVREIRERIGEEGKREGGTLGRGGRLGESARLFDRVLRSSESVVFPSGRMGGLTCVSAATRPGLEAAGDRGERVGFR